MIAQEYEKSNSNAAFCFRKTVLFVLYFLLKLYIYAFLHTFIPALLNCIFVCNMQEIQKVYALLSVLATPINGMGQETALAWHALRKCSTSEPTDTITQRRTGGPGRSSVFSALYFMCIIHKKYKKYNKFCRYVLT